MRFSQPCQVCNVKKFRKNASGLFCINGHRVEEFREEVVEEDDYRPSARKSGQKVKKGRRKSSRVRVKSIKSEVTSDAVYEIFQYALRFQVCSFITCKRLPKDLENESNSEERKEEDYKPECESRIFKFKAPAISAIKHAHATERISFNLFIYGLPRAPITDNDVGYSSPSIPQLSAISTSVKTFMQFFQYEYELIFPPVNKALLAIEISRRLRLPLELHMFALILDDLRNRFSRKKEDLEDEEMLYCLQAQEAGAMIKTTRGYGMRFVFFQIYPAHIEISGIEFVAEGIRVSETSSAERMNSPMPEDDRSDARQFWTMDISNYLYLMEERIKPPDTNGGILTDHAVIAIELARLAGIETAEMLDEIRKCESVSLNLWSFPTLISMEVCLDSCSCPVLTIHEDALASQEYIRLTSSVPGMHGSVWAKEPNPHREWQVEFSFSAFGRAYAGGDGLAFWYAKDPGLEGPVYGVADKWTGLGLFFDTAEVNENRFTPYLFAIVNDGRVEIHNRHDVLLHAIGGCFRGLAASSAKLDRFRLQKFAQAGLGKIDLDIDLKQDDDYEYQMCFEKKDLDLPIGYHFGFSAGTSDHSADDHDLFSFETYELNPVTKKKKKNAKEFKIDEDTRKKIEQTEEAINQYQKDSYPEYGESATSEFNPHIVQMIEENQFKIVESMDILYQKLDPDAASTQNSDEQTRNSIHDAVKPVDEKVSRLNARLEDLVEKAKYLSKSIETLHIIIRDSHTKGGQTLQEVARKLEASHLQLDAAHQALQLKPSSTSWAFFSMFFLLGGIIVYMASVFVRMRQKSSQKYF
ncbi:Protein ERGIC-53-like [Dinochytrium kinnereticum]|nr:Protein ERGIC-53-like [Dinochytrium kinnereticum]